MQRRTKNDEVARKLKLKSASAGCKFDIMENTTRVYSATNQHRSARAQEMLAELLSEVLRQGVYGQATLSLTIHDGTIQRLGRTVERFER
jgi:hypothetical protein